MHIASRAHEQSLREASYAVARVPKRSPAVRSIDHLGASMRYARNVEIFGEDEASGYFYKVVSGAVRGCRNLSDGRRQVCAFYLPGDVFGLEAGELHTYSAEAIDEVSVVIFKRSAVIAAATERLPDSSCL